MSFYDNSSGSWSPAGRHPSWEPQPPSRSDTGSALSQRADSTAFASQFEEIDRATDNLMKSGKWFPAQAAAGASVPGTPARRESVPAGGRTFAYDPDPRLGGPSRHQSMGEYDSCRPVSAALQGYYAGQRFPGGRQNEAEQMLQAKRRMAAQRERELRNYHQEQQYNRKAVSGGKTTNSDRSMSPATMSEDDRRELIARQHRALYGDNSSLYHADGTRSQSQDVRVPSGGRGPSPLAYDPFGVQAQGGAEGAVQMPPRDRAESTASPASNPPHQQFGLLSNAQQSSRTSSSSPGASPPLAPGATGIAQGVAPIGTRPPHGPGSTGAVNNRSVTPLAPSSLSYGFNASDGQHGNMGKNERSTSAASNPAPAERNAPGLGNWGSNSGHWGSSKTTLAVQPSVWG